MNDFTIHTIETAPEGSKASLMNVKANFGVIPNLAAGMAESPSLIKGFFGLREIYFNGSLSDGEIQVLSIVNAIENNCGWCVAFHTFFALKAGISYETVMAIRSGENPTESRLKALSDFTRALIRTRGNVTQEQSGDFFAAGFTKAQALEVVLGVAFSVMANFSNHLIQAPLDAMFAEYKWNGK